ncbi:Asialoglycoprotein receptor 2 like [Melia azedarach]|uniref:Asialoglycoprotein receptor 2 like n=1 Tax=Melia azedarach TaxID=155640 RepID=A0ACC1WRD1_MELAZ|nr:Asialoglycoprotein receptor 2 like [Melia azedarach]
MEGTSSSPRSTDEAAGGLLSCWGRFKLKLPWTKRRIWRDTRRQTNVCWNIAAAFRAKNPKPAGGFKYDPLSYAQNFDEGCWDEGNVDSLSRGFSSRYAAPSKSLGV